MAENTKFNAENYIKNMYDSQLKSEKETLTQNYEQNAAELERQQEAARKQKDEDLTRTYVEAAKTQKNYNEVQNAYGLTSGAMAQARLAQDNQLQADMTAIRTAQQSIDADVEREKGILAKEYASAIAKAQANNDLARAEALYQQAQLEDERLQEKQLAAANLMAGAGDYSLIAQLYGLTPEQVAKLQSGNQGYVNPNGGELDDVVWGEGLQDSVIKIKADQFQQLAKMGTAGYDQIEKEMAAIAATGKLSQAQAEYLEALLAQIGYTGG